MIHTDDRFAQAVADAVTAIERRTDAEVVVVAAARSGTYADVSARTAAVAMWVGAIVLLAIPHAIGPVWFVVDLALVGLATERLARGSWWIRRTTRASRRRQQVRDAAQAELVREAVHGTPRRTGVLVYLSALEAQVEVVGDLGVQGRVPGGALQPAIDRLDADDLDGFLAGLAALGDVLARYLPHTEDSDDTDLPNAPRIRP
ncbi:MAG: hypothetical protein H6733_05785 [Alphaproteobacteria bacterium]|nr:hypothetical protein [Alphaproteobacteria bacterium]